jgi:GTP-binding protein
MKFVDEATIKVQAGKGGSGRRSFRRETFVPLGGPDGGEGGDGGSVILLASRNVQTLLDFRFRPEWKAKDGDQGGANNRAGRSAEDLTLLLPIGTEVLNEAGEVIVDLVDETKPFVLCKGGRGGKGNTFFKSAVNRGPEYFQPGEPGEAGTFTLSLKLVADVGLVGFPNAGKSTLISRISAARPKVADYPFTTLEPNLGVAQWSNVSFVVADIPGLIPDAHLGKGLGVQFLKHIERTRVIAHLIDCQQMNDAGEPQNLIEAWETINRELGSFSPELLKKPTLVVLTKIDTLPADADLEELKAPFIKKGASCILLSSASGKGVDDLLRELAQLVQEERRREGI